jgi:hypothetical protein
MMSELERYALVSDVVAAALMASYVVWTMWRLGWSRGVLLAVAASSLGPWIALLEPSVSVVAALKIALVCSAFAMFTIANWPALRPGAGESLMTWLGLRDPR